MQFGHGLHGQIDIFQGQAILLVDGVLVTFKGQIRHNDHAFTPVRIHVREYGSAEIHLKPSMDHSEAYTECNLGHHLNVGLFLGNEPLKSWDNFFIHQNFLLIHVQRFRDAFFLALKAIDFQHPVVPLRSISDDMITRHVIA